MTDDSRPEANAIGGRAGAKRQETAFYCVSSAEYFLGAVAMINSLRLAGHDESILVCDAGLTARQRDRLRAEATVVPAPPGREPYTLKAVLPLAAPSHTTVLIDTDMIVLRSLHPLIAEATGGRVVAFENPTPRFDERWAGALDLPRVERRPYLCSGLVAAGDPVATTLLRMLEKGSGVVAYERTYFGSHDETYPLLYAEQDVLNAVLGGAIDPALTTALPASLAPMVPFAGVELVDEERLVCAYTATGPPEGPYLLHHSLSPKPWQRTAGEGIYTRLLRRLLLSADVPVTVPSTEVPLGLRDGALGRAERRRAAARDRLRWSLGRARRRVEGRASARG